MSLDPAGWEQRMSDRARARAEEEAARRARAWQQEAREHAWKPFGGVQRMPSCPFDPDPPWAEDPHVLEVTLGEAIGWMRDMNGAACACIGPPRCCQNVWAQAFLLRREAQLVAKQLAGLAARRPPPPP